MKRADWNQSLGGKIGIWCSHSYPHNTKRAARIFPRAVKGADLVMYAALESLGIEVKIQPAFVMYKIHEKGYDYGDGYGECPARDWFEFASPTNRRRSWDAKADSETDEPDVDEYEASSNVGGHLAMHVGERLKSHISENWPHETKYGNEQEVSACGSLQMI